MIRSLPLSPYKVYAMIRCWHHYRNERAVWRLITLYHMEQVFGADVAQRVRQRATMRRAF